MAIRSHVRCTRAHAPCAQVGGEKNGSHVAVAAPYFTTANAKLGDKPFVETVGYHYCKLLSPARAIEWMYVDGLRAFGGLN